MTSTRSDAQLRCDDIRIFNRELARLEEAAVLNLDSVQREAVDGHHQRLLAHYAEEFDIDRNAEARQLSLGMRIASFLGALALAASVFFLFYQFWGYFPIPAQVSILVAAPVLSLLVTHWIQGRDNSGYFTKLAALVSFSCLVLNLVMLGEIFSITTSDKALLPWAAFAFLLAYALDLRLLLAAAILCVMGFVAARTGTWNGMYWLDFGDRPENFFPACLLLFFIPILINHSRFNGFAVIYRTLSLTAFFIAALILAHFGDGSYFNLPRNIIEGGYEIFSFVSAALVITYGVRKQWPDVINTGTTFFVIFLYTKLFDWWWESIPKYLFFLILGLIALLLLFIFRRLRYSLLPSPIRSGGAA